MHKIVLALVLLTSFVTDVLGEKVVLGPDLQRVISREPILRHPTRIQVTPRQITTPADSWETVPLHGERLETGFAGLRFESMLDYTNYPDGPYGGFVFEAGDTALVWFRPADGCTLSKVDIRFNADGELTGETVMVQIYTIKESWVDSLGGNLTYDFSKADFVTGDNGPHDVLLAEVPVTITEVGINAVYEIDFSEWGGSVEIGYNDFAVVIGLPPGNGGGADFYYSQFWDDRGQHHGFKYYHDAAGWKSRFNFMFLATVDYYGGQPGPVIENVPDLNDVYYSDNPGPYPISATIYDIGTAVFEGGLTAVRLHYIVNDGNPQVIDLSSQIPSANDVYNAEFTGLVVGDFLEYYFYAADNGADDPNGGINHEVTSFPRSFAIREANPNAGILLVDDNSRGIGTEFWAPDMNAAGWVYDYWDIASSGIPTLGILSNYQALLWAQGSGTGGILADHDMDMSLMAPYLDNGGNLFLSSSDYMGVREDNFAQEWRSATHPFLTNYLHVNDYVSDANIGEGNTSENILYRGVENSPVSAVYADSTFLAIPETFGFYNWADMAQPTADADTAFLVHSENDGDWKGAGTVYDGDYKVVFLPWQFEAIVDGDIRSDLLSNIVDFLGPDCPGMHIPYLGGDRYAQSVQAGDVKVYGPDNSANPQITQSVTYTLDGGQSWASVPMINGEANIPALAVGDTCAFRITASDDEGCTNYSNTINVWKIDFTPTADILYVGDDYYTWHYGANYDSVNFARTRDVIRTRGLTVEYYDLDSLYLMDTRSILNHYYAVIWNAYADWDPAYMPVSTFDNPLTDFVEQGGRLLYSSEEMIGTWFGWPQYQDFFPGDFMYDVLSVNWAANDFGLDSIITDPTGYFTMGLGNFNLESSNFAFGNRNDLCDPIGFWGGDYASGPFLSYEGVLGWGANPISSQTDKTLFLAFSMMQMPDHIYWLFICEWLTGGNCYGSVDSELPTELSLSQNYPNPFNPTTNIQFDVPEYEQVTLSIYNVLGQKIIDMVDKEYSPGYYDIQWNGVDQQGKPVSSGLYIYRLTAGGNHINKKMVFLK